MHEGRRIKIPVVEESSHEWKKFARIDNADLEGRPLKVLKKFVDDGVEREWWTGKTLRESEAFRKLVELCWGKEFLENLERLRRRKFGDAEPK